MSVPLLLRLKILRPHNIRGMVRYYLDEQQSISISIGAAAHNTILIAQAAPEHLTLHISGTTICFAAQEACKIKYRGKIRRLKKGQEVKSSLQALRQSAPTIIVGESHITLDFKVDQMVLHPKQRSQIKKYCGAVTKIGQGDTSMVYKVQQEEANRALKILLPGYSDDQERRKRFLIAADISKHLPAHPSIIKIYESVYEQKLNLYWLEMEYFPGETLKNLVGRQGPLSVEAATCILQNVVQGLSMLHAQRIWHRNLSPSNVLVSPQGSIKLIGFSLIKAEGLEQTIPGSKMIAPNFTAPEQVRNPVNAGPRADVFSLGALLYTLLMGEPPFGAHYVREYEEMIEDLPSPDLSTPQTSRISSNLQDVLLASLSPDPHDRAESAEAWGRLLQKAINRPPGEGTNFSMSVPELKIVELPTAPGAEGLEDLQELAIDTEARDKAWQQAWEQAHDPQDSLNHTQPASPEEINQLRTQRNEYLAAENWQAALEVLERLIQIDPTLKRQIDRAELLRRTQRYCEAIAAFETILQQAPHNQRAQKGLRLARRQLSQCKSPNLPAYATEHLEEPQLWSTGVYPRLPQNYGKWMTYSLPQLQQLCSRALQQKDRVQIQYILETMRYKVLPEWQPYSLNELRKLRAQYSKQKNLPGMLLTLEEMNRRESGQASKNYKRCFNLAVCYMRLLQYQPALEIFREVARLPPGKQYNQIIAMSKRYIADLSANKELETQLGSVWIGSQITDKKTLAEPDCEPTLPEVTVLPADVQSVINQKNATRLGPYILYGQIGKGGMGIVYKAYHCEERKVFAIKTVHASGDQKENERFKREAAIARILRHKYIIPVHEVVSEGTQQYIVMKYVPAKDLAKLLEEKRVFAPYQALDIITKIVEALEYAHKKNIIHRDIKPANILLHEQTPYLLDFGLADWAQKETHMTKTGDHLGTIGYMSPEQVRGEWEYITVRSDIYSVGGVFYEMITGERLVKSTCRAHAVYQVERWLPYPPSKKNRAVPKEMDAVCLKCLAKKPSARYQTATELLQDLRRLQRNEPVAAPPIGCWYYFRYWCSMHSQSIQRIQFWLIILSLLIILALSLTLWIMVAQH